MIMHWHSTVGVALSITVVAIVMKFVWVVAHPIMAHRVDGRGRREPSQVDFTVKERHHVRNMSVRESIDIRY